MRLLMAAFLSCGSMVQGAYAQVPARGQENTTNTPSRAGPQKSFRICGNTACVGPPGLGVFLVTARTGDVLIDTGVPGDAPLIEANIRDPGVHLRDIKWILSSHAHSDHAGGMAQLAHDAGAQAIANAADIPLLERGGRDDSQYDNRTPVSTRAGGTPGD